MILNQINQVDQIDNPEHRCGTVAIIGRPNVGKSTLLNRILGQKLVITSHKAQTTRHAILGIKTRPDGQIIFIDTPGIHQRGGSALNRYLNRTARATLNDTNTDLILFILEALRWTTEDEQVLNAINQAAIPTLAVINKIDRVAIKSELLPFLVDINQKFKFLELIPISATKGEQIELLESAVLRALPVGQAKFPPDQLTDRSERFYAAELMREQLVRRYGAELPYCTTVEIESFVERANRYWIRALIWVERPNQRMILIGKHGSALKATASEARRQMEKLFAHSIHLTVWIKVAQSWSSKELALTHLGYHDASSR